MLCQFRTYARGKKTAVLVQILMHASSNQIGQGNSHLCAVAGLKSREWERASSKVAEMIATVALTGWWTVLDGGRYRMASKSSLTRLDLCLDPRKHYSWVHISTIVVVGGRKLHGELGVPGHAVLIVSYDPLTKEVVLADPNAPGITMQFSVDEIFEASK